MVLQKESFICRGKRLGSGLLHGFIKCFFCCHALIRLKEEQRWIGMPEWKKHLLRRRGTDQLYHGYHAVNTGHPGIRRTMSWKLPEMSAEEECDEVTRPRAISTLE